MKKQHIIPSLILLSVVLLVLSACSGKKLTATDFDQIKIGMTNKQIEKKLGKPVKIVSSQDKAKNLLAQDTKYLAKVLVGGDQTALKKFVGKQTDLEKLINKFSRMKSFKVYQYQYRDKNDQQHTKNVYLQNNKVFWMKFE